MSKSQKPQVSQSTLKQALILVRAGTRRNGKRTISLQLAVALVETIKEEIAHQAVLKPEPSNSIRERRVRGIIAAHYGASSERQSQPTLKPSSAPDHPNPLSSNEGHGPQKNGACR